MWVVFGPVWATLCAHSGAARTKSDDQEEEAEEGQRDAVAPQPSVGQVPGAAALDVDSRRRGGKSFVRLSARESRIRLGLESHCAGAYLNSKLVRSWPKVGLKITFSRLIALETKVESVRFP